MTTSGINENAAGRVLRLVIVTCSLLLCAPRLVAQSVSDSGTAQVAVPPTELKSGTAATIMSVFLPGLGHLYAEDARTGVVLIALFAGAIVVARGDGENCAAGPIAALLCGGPWFYGVIDAHNAAARYNRAHATKTPEVQVSPVILAGENGSWRFGIAVRLTR